MELILKKTTLVFNNKGIFIMEIEIKLPDIGKDKMEITEILVKTGEKVKKDQSLITIEGDKTSIEVPSKYSGIIKDIKIKIGDKIKTGCHIMTLESKNNLNKHVKNLKNNKNINEKLNKKNKCIKYIEIPFINLEFLKVNKIMIKIGDKINKDQLLFEFKNNNNTILIKSPCEGIIKKININIGDKIKTGIKIIDLYENIQFNIVNSFKKNEKNILLLKTNNKDNNNEIIYHASPSIRRLIRKSNINIKDIKPSGRKNRILKEDIELHINNIYKNNKNKKINLSKINEISFLPWPEIDFNKFGKTEKKNISNISKISGSCLHRNWISIPHVTHFDEIDITRLEIYRKQKNLELENNNINFNITILVFIIKAISNILEEIPKFNSSLSKDLKSLIIKKYINIGIAVNTKNGLLVPVIYNTNKKNILQILCSLRKISKKAREGRLISNEIKGGSFTISSLGGIGGMSFTPIINAPEVAILGISKSFIKPVWNGEKFIPKLVLPISLSYDHRVIDGADGAYFINRIKSSIKISLI
ncbi:MAG: 2-oxo acid dehydrogenase subunit E2 [Enterobacterales bacterium]